MINLLLNDDFATTKKALFENSVLSTSFFMRKENTNQRGKFSFINYKFLIKWVWDILLTPTFSLFF